MLFLTIEDEVLDFGAVGSEHVDVSDLFWPLITRIGQEWKMLGFDYTRKRDSCEPMETGRVEYQLQRPRDDNDFGSFAFL